MEMSLIFSLILAFCGIISSSSKVLTDEQLRALYDSVVDIEEYVNNIFTLSAPQQLYIYEYSRDVIKNLEKDSKMATFLQASLKLLQKKVDDFNEHHKFEKITTRKFLQQLINLQLKSPDTTQAPGNATKPLSSSEESSTVDKSANKFQPTSMNNTTNPETDPKPKPKNSKKLPLKPEQEKIPQKSSPVHFDATYFSKNSSVKPEKLESSVEKKLRTKSESTSSLPKKETISKTPSSKSKAKDKKSTPLSSSFQVVLQ